MRAVAPEHNHPIGLVLLNVMRQRAATESPGWYSPPSHRLVWERTIDHAQQAPAAEPFSIEFNDRNGEILSVYAEAALDTFIDNLIEDPLAGLQIIPIQLLHRSPHTGLILASIIYTALPEG